jgi:hypothetical protein
LTVELDDLILQFSRLPHAVVGHGPRHPVSPDPSIEQDVSRFLEEHPSLRRDAGYVEFLEKYSGAAFDYPDQTVAVEIIGFSSESMNVYELDSPVVQDGLMVFALCAYHSFRDGGIDTYEHDFAIAADDRRKPGIYRYYGSTRHPEPSVSWHAEDFVTWLEEFVGRGGRYERLDAEGES